MNTNSSTKMSQQNEAEPASMLNAGKFWEAFEEEERRYRNVADGIRSHNIGAIFDELRSAEISSLEVDFDGGGDSGQIGGITLLGASQDILLPTSTVNVLEPKRDGSGYDTTAMGFEEALEALIFALLEEIQAGWECEDGAFGEFTFDVPQRSITLDFNERVSDVHSQSFAW